MVIKRMNKMVITIDSSRVPACEMKIASKDRILYDDILFSNSANKIEIDGNEIESLEFKWNFNLSKARYVELERELEYASTNRSAQNPPRLLSGFDKIFNKLYPDPINSIFSTIIESIPSGMENLYLIFRGTSFFDRIPLLDVASAEDDFNLNIFFSKCNNLDAYFKLIRMRRMRYLSYKSIEFMFIIFIGIMLENLYPNFYLIYLLVAFAIAEMNGIVTDKRRIRMFLDKIENVKQFKETEYGIEIIKYDD